MRFINATAWLCHQVEPFTQYYTLRNKLFIMPLNINNHSVLCNHLEKISSHEAPTTLYLRLRRGRCLNANVQPPTFIAYEYLKNVMHRTLFVTQMQNQTLHRCNATHH